MMVAVNAIRALLEVRLIVMYVRKQPEPGPLLGEATAWSHFWATHCKSPAEVRKTTFAVISTVASRIMPAWSISHNKNEFNEHSRMPMTVWSEMFGLIAFSSWIAYGACANGQATVGTRYNKSQQQRRLQRKGKRNARHPRGS